MEQQDSLFPAVAPRQVLRTVKKSSKDLDETINELNSVDAESSARNSKRVERKKSYSSSRYCGTKEKEKKKERWLLTRKTWKYMTDAGRKLIPDNVQNRKEDIAKVEAHFQQLCAAEPRFVLWRRKSSYPGARKSSLRHFKQVLRYPRHSQPNSVATSTDAAIAILHTHLKLDDTFKTASLLGSHTIRPDQTASPSAQRPTNLKISPLVDCNETEQLLTHLQSLAKNSLLNSLAVEPEHITHELLEDKNLLRKIYNLLKKQQLHRILTKHSSLPITPKADITRVSSLKSLFHFGDGPSSWHKSIDDKFGQHRKKAQEKQLETTRLTQPVIASDKGARLRKNCASCGSQTLFIQLSEIKYLASLYQEVKRDDPLMDQVKSSQHSGRKSSIDNEDVSQSVSDTIKRYLRMARKKGPNDTNQMDRFTRVNYDRNLRNIKAKKDVQPSSELNENDKATQTLDAWALIALEFIRGNESSSVLQVAHANEEYEKNMRNDDTQTFKQSASSCGSRSTPTSPTGGNLSSAINQSLSEIFVSSLNISNVQSTMQKSKSSSNIGQYVTRKILNRRSKSQTRLEPEPLANNSPSKQTWTPTSKLTWTSDNGDCIQIKEISLQNLSKTEIIILQRLAYEKIHELNIELAFKWDAKDGKRRILPKKRAITTSFFDVGKKGERDGDDACVFGTSLENCIACDRKQHPNLKMDSEHLSKNFLASMFGSSRSSDNNKLHENVRSCESLPVKSLESGISRHHPAAKLIKNTSGYLYNLTKSRSQKDMRRQSDDLDGTFDLENSKIDGTESSHFQNICDINELNVHELQVPRFVTSCINYLEEKGLNTVGLFRVGTSKKRVKQIRENFVKCHMYNITDDASVHDIATLLKEFLRDLPEPLLCNHLYKAFLKTQKIRNRRLQFEAISHLIALLPKTHRDTLYVLLRFLAKVATSCDDVFDSAGNLQVTGNKMDAMNLAIVFAPNILRSTIMESGNCTKDNSVDEKQLMNDTINVIRIMIDHYEELYKVPAEFVETIYSHMLEECPEILNTLLEQRKTSNSCQLKSPKRLYSRESVIHHNDASKTPDIKPKFMKESNRHSIGRSGRGTTSAVDVSGSLSSLMRCSTPVETTAKINEKGVLSISLEISIPKQTTSKYANYDCDLKDCNDDVFFNSLESYDAAETEQLPISGTLALCSSGNVQEPPKDKTLTRNASPYYDKDPKSETKIITSEGISHKKHLYKRQQIIQSAKRFNLKQTKQ